MKRRTLTTILILALLGNGSIALATSATFFASAQSTGKLEQSKPAPAPARWRGLIGEYGPDDNILIILEKDGKLAGLFKRTELEVLTEVSRNIFRFPAQSAHAKKVLIFERNPAGRATEASFPYILRKRGVIARELDVEHFVLKRRNIEPESGNQLRIKPVRPVTELMREALAARAPWEEGEFLETDMVELTKLDPTIRLEIRYATTNNFLGTKFYPVARAYMQRPAAEALIRAHRNLKRKGYGLLIHDAYRPWYVTKVFWDATPEDKKWFVADPSKGSRHNRGCAVDLTLYNLRTGKPVEMVSTYDETTDRAHSDYPGGTSLQRWHRESLRKAMEAEGFTVYAPEWWHFDYRDWQRYRIGNVGFYPFGK